MRKDTSCRAGWSLLVLFMAGCVTSNDVSRVPAYQGGYTPAQTYQLRVDVYLVEKARTALGDALPGVMTLVLPKDRPRFPASQVVGSLNHGTRLELHSLRLSSHPDEGEMTRPVASVTEGPFAGRLVLLEELSNHYFYPEMEAWLAFPNPAYLEMVEPTPSL